MDLELFADIVIRNVRDFVEPALRELADETTALRKRIEALEAVQLRSLAEEMDNP